MAFFDERLDISNNPSICASISSPILKYLTAPFIERLDLSINLGPDRTVGDRWSGGRFNTCHPPLDIDELFERPNPIQNIL